MTPYTEEELEERYQKLPEVLKDAMTSAEVSGTMVSIGKKFGLTLEKIGFMAEEAGYVMLGLIRPQEFIGKLAEALEISRDRAAALAQEINHQVFAPIREALKSAHQYDLSDEVMQKGEVALPQRPEEKKIVPEVPSEISVKVPAVLKETSLPLTKKPEVATPPPSPIKMQGGIFVPPKASQGPSEEVEAPKPKEETNTFFLKKPTRGPEDPYREPAEIEAPPPAATKPVVPAKKPTPPEPAAPKIEPEKPSSIIPPTPKGEVKLPEKTFGSTSEPAKKPEEESAPEEKSAPPENLLVKPELPGPKNLPGQAPRPAPSPFPPKPPSPPWSSSKIPPIDLRNQKPPQQPQAPKSPFPPRPNIAKDDPYRESFG